VSDHVHSMRDVLGDAISETDVSSLNVIALLMFELLIMLLSVCAVRGNFQHRYISL
jgi:hypothetical protein